MSIPFEDLHHTHHCVTGERGFFFFFFKEDQLSVGGSGSETPRKKFICSSVFCVLSAAHKNQSYLSAAALATLTG